MNGTRRHSVRTRQNKTLHSPQVQARTGSSSEQGHLPGGPVRRQAEAGLPGKAEGHPRPGRLQERLQHGSAGTQNLGGGCGESRTWGSVQENGTR